MAASSGAYLYFYFMAKKHSRRRRSLGKRNKRGGLVRSLRTLVVSAVVSFGVATWAINPQLIESIDIDALITALDLDRFIGERQTSLPAASVEGYVQTSFAECKGFFPEQKPPMVPAGEALRELCFTPFAILHSGKTKTPVFVAQRLNRQMLKAGQEVERTDRFYEEARLPRAERASLKDYKGTGYDRGHMSPAGDMHNEEAMAQSFSLANIVPQDAQHNRGAWSSVENDTRKYVMRAQGDVYIFTGPVYEPQPETIGERRVAVPTYIYKVVYDATTGMTRVHWHENSSEQAMGKPISYQKFVRRTGLDFLGLSH